MSTVAFPSSGANLIAQRPPLEFCAGLVYVSPELRAVPDERRGRVIVRPHSLSEYTLEWRTRPGDQIGLHIRFSRQSTWQRVSECTDGRVFVLTAHSALGSVPIKYFFWMQEPSVERDNEVCAFMEEALRSVASPTLPQVDSRLRPTAASIASSIAAANRTIPQPDVSSTSVTEIIRPQASAATAPAASAPVAAAPPAPTSAVNIVAAPTSAPPSATTASTVAISASAASASAAPAPAASASTAPAPAHSSLNLLDWSRRRQCALPRVLNPERVVPILEQHPEVMRALLPYLPTSQQSVEQVVPTLRSAQLHALTTRLNSMLSDPQEATTVMQSFGLARPAQSGAAFGMPSVRDFTDAIQALADKEVAEANEALATASAAAATDVPSSVSGGGAGSAGAGDASGAPSAFSK